MAQSNPGQPPNPQPSPPPEPPQPTPAPGTPRPPRDPNAPADPARTEAELKARTDKEVAERVEQMASPEQPTPTQEEADAIREGRYDATAPEGQRVKSREEHAERQRRAMQPADSVSGYATR